MVVVGHRTSARRHGANEQFVFGYGSLATIPAPTVKASLQGFARRWNAAMDNRVTLPGYKYYIDPVTGDRPEVYVTYLGIHPEADAAVEGVLMPVDGSRLARLDGRERNYVRVEVTDRISPSAPGRVHAYVPSDAARDRLAAGMAAGTAVIDNNYLTGVEAGFAALGPSALERFRATTPPPPCPRRNLRRIDVPPDQ